MEYMNYNQNKAEVHSSNLAVEGPSSIYEDAADPEGMITTKLWSAANTWGLTCDTPNTIYGGADDKIYVDIATFFDADGAPFILALDYQHNKIDVFNSRTGVLTDTSDLLTDDLPAPAGATWFPYSMCTDGTYAFVCFTNTNPNPDTYQIQAWEIATWDVKTGWAATGTALPSAANHSLITPGKVIIADADHLATLNSWVVIAADTSDAISIINRSDGSIDNSASGDAPTAVSAQAYYGICSDGTNIFFGAYAGAPTNIGYICSATIANPTTGCGGANFSDPGGFALTGPADAIISSMCALGPNLCVAGIADNTGIVATSHMLRTFNSADADLDIITSGQNSAAAPAGGDEYIISGIYSMAFDGINLWCAGSVNNAGADFQVSAVKIDAAKLSAVDTGTDKQLSDVTSSSFLMAPNDIIGVGGTYWLCSVTFDGRDILVEYNGLTSASASATIYRLPMALLRH
ncbi:hypothetical protein [Candidatus Magnetobacterium casense]|uniref:Uncharacterized protein n=1 Tax=Candidatus Magnetobacterium casense TaxID=1455061 RepID=A0ABS6RWI0_9BACT|nr:hypothetical protein [Candidatus Magnetobacterium casensis]MBV6340977.1 hypothetical protein [Candidatus Magnetobacterium casensis]